MRKRLASMLFSADMSCFGRAAGNNIIPVASGRLCQYQEKNKAVAEGSLANRPAQGAGITIHARPTVTEAVREAMLAAEKRAVHIPNK